MVDYYHVLGVFRTAMPEDIKKAYHQEAMRWHPDTHPNNRVEAELRFKELSEAFEVLSDANRRGIYDKFGIEGLTGAAGHQFGVFTFRNPMDVFKDCFGGQNPCSQVFGMQGSPGNMNVRHAQMSFSQSFGGFPAPRMEMCGVPMVGLPGAMPRVGLAGTGLAGAGLAGAGLGGAGQAIPGFSSFHSSTFGGGNVGGQSVSTSTSIINGKQIMTKRISGGGEERVEIYEDGKLTSVTVNGQEQLDKK